MRRVISCGKAFRFRLKFGFIRFGGPAPKPNRSPLISAVIIRGLCGLVKYLLIG
jgi:hypothetical protein